MTTTVLALFKDRRDAEGAIRALRDAHFELARLGIVPPDEAHVPRQGKAAVAGVVGGAVGCGAAGVLIGIIAGGFIPFLPAWLPGGWFLPFMIGIAGAGTGAVAGLLMSRSIVEPGALFYDEKVKTGRTLVSVNAEAPDVERVRRLLLDAGAFDASPIEAPIRRRGLAG